MITDEQAIRELCFLTRSYDAVNKMTTATINRLRSLKGDDNWETHWLLKGDQWNKGKTVFKQVGLEYLKGRITRQIEGILPCWPIWAEWMKNVPGIGPDIAGHLILLYYYKFTTICATCGTDVEKVDHGFYCPKCEKKLKQEKKEGRTVVNRIEFRDFPMISSWWKYMGVHNSEHCPVCPHPRRRVKHVDKDTEGREWLCQIVKGKNGKKYGCGRMYKQSEVVFNKPMRQAGMKSDWSNLGRQTAYQIGDQFSYKPRNTGNLYRDYYDRRRQLRDKTHPDARDGYKYNMCRNETAKMFLSHFWQVARVLEGLPLTDPYINAKDPIHKIIAPFYWEGKLDKAA